MDHVLNNLDPYFFDSFYGTYLPTWNRDYWVRQYCTIAFIWWLGGTLSYLLISGVSYIFLFDKTSRKSPKFLENQEMKEITLSLISIPLMAVPSTFIFLAEVRGYSKLYDGIGEGSYGWAYMALTVVLYLFFTDTCIYWIHKWLHIPIFYKYIHKPHHRWLVPTPFASYAFHPADGFLQSTPYHVFAFLVPLNKYLYLGLFIFVCCWTVSIHDGKGVYMGKIINGADHHTIHHSDFLYNYGQYFTFWDRVMNTHREPKYNDYGQMKKDDGNNKIVDDVKTKRSSVVGSSRSH